MEAARALRDSLAKPSRTLWAISDEMEALATLICENDGELTPDMEAAFDTLNGDFAAKVERVALFIRDREIKAEGAKLERDRLDAIQKAHAREVKRMKDLLLAVMERQGRDKVDTSKARVSRVQSPWSYRWLGDTYEAIPDQFRRTKTVCTLNTDAVKDAIAKGEHVPPEIVVERSHHIRIA